MKTKKTVPVRRARRAQAPKKGKRPEDWREVRSIPDGWREVPVGSRIQKQDYFWCSDRFWLLTRNPGAEVTLNSLTYIRPIPETAKRSAERPARSRTKTRNKPVTPKTPTRGRKAAK